MARSPAEAQGTFTPEGNGRLQREGVVEVHDYTRYFQGENGPECRMYWDLYHQNTLGQDRLTDALLPILEKRLYSRSPAARNP